MMDKGRHRFNPIAILLSISFAPPAIADTCGSVFQNAYLRENGCFAKNVSKADCARVGGRFQLDRGAGYDYCEFSPPRDAARVEKSPQRAPPIGKRTEQLMKTGETLEQYSARKFAEGVSHLESLELEGKYQEAYVQLGGLRFYAEQMRSQDKLAWINKQEKVYSALSNWQFHEASSAEKIKNARDENDLDSIDFKSLEAATEALSGLLSDRQRFVLLDLQVGSLKAEHARKKADFIRRSVAERINVCEAKGGRVILKATSSIKVPPHDWPSYDAFIENSECSIKAISDQDVRETVKELKNKFGIE